MAETAVAYYIDDEAADAHANITRLNEAGGERFSVEYLAPSPTLELGTVSDDVQLFFVDWELNREQADGIHVDYKGGTFASRLREAFPDVPIILTTRENILDERTRAQYIDSLVFDEFVSKRQIGESPDVVVAKALDLVEGFATLHNAKKTWSGLLTSLRAKALEGESVGEAAPPLIKDEDACWRVAETAKWLRSTLIRYPGILYNSLHAATYLGITEAAFAGDDIQRLFGDARYAGALAPSDGRWWRERVESTALKVIADAGFAGSSVNRQFADAYRATRGTELELAVCIVSGNKPADWVCYISRAPVLVEYSLLYLPDNRPAIMDDARVSFKAIRESPDVFDEYFDASSRHLLPEVRR